MTDLGSTGLGSIESEMEDESHTPQAITHRLTSPPGRSNLRDLIYGGIDGAVTTFAVVAGVAGAKLSTTIVIVLGVANLIADGFSMAVSNFLATRTESEQRAQARSDEEREIRTMPDEEREEIRQIFAMKGFTGTELERVVDVITADPAVWLETMMIEELGYGRADARPWRAAASTFVAFVVVGVIPLTAFVLELFAPGVIGDPFLWSLPMTGLAFFAVGALKSRFVARSWWRAGMETLFLGGCAAAIAYLLGAVLQKAIQP